MSCYVIAMATITPRNLGAKFPIAATHLIIQDWLSEVCNLAFMYFHEYPIRLGKIIITELWESLSPYCGVYDAYGIIIRRNLGVVVSNVVDSFDMVEYYANTWVKTGDILGCIMYFV